MTSTTTPRRRPSAILHRRVLLALAAVSLAPMILMGVGTWVVIGRVLEERAIDLQRQVVTSHARSIEQFLARQVELLRLLAETSNLARLTADDGLESAFAALDRASGGGFVDLGVIGADGRHLRYRGPYDLADRNYADSEWYREVMVRGSYVSDVFLGFRGVPHLVVAVRVDDGHGPWVLRATLESEHFEQLVTADDLGASGAAYLVGTDGRYQTTPPLGTVLDQATLPFLEPHSGVRVLSRTVAGEPRLVVTTWLNHNRWLLVVERSTAEVRAPLARALALGAGVMATAFLLVVGAIALATRLLGRQIDRADRQRDEMTRAFMRSARLASVGELATGLAQEINNPLAIIAAEQTNLADVLLGVDCPTGSAAEVEESLDRIRRQVRRCGNITAKMLQFGRQREPQLERVDVAERLREVARLLERQATVRNVELEVEAAAGLPPVRLDAVELEQVLVNLVTNAFAAMPSGGLVTLLATAAAGEVVVEVRDSGVGMTPEILERAFEPFFTTKPVGQGTGLGLAVCFGLVTGWNGRIEADSEPGHGTTIRLRLPLADDQEGQR